MAMARRPMPAAYVLTVLRMCSIIPCRFNASADMHKGYISTCVGISETVTLMDCVPAPSPKSWQVRVYTLCAVIAPED